MSKIFISHSRANNAAALAIGEWLKQNCWGDHFLDISPETGLSPGERWRDELKKAADRCEAVLCLVSSAWLESKECLLEFGLAKYLGKTIFAALIENIPLHKVPAE